MALRKGPNVLSRRKKQSICPQQIKIAGTKGSAEALGELRKIEVQGGVLRDEFEPWGVRLYKIATK